MKYIEKCTFQNMASILEEQRVGYASILKGSTAEHELVFKIKECNLALKLKTTQEDATIPSGYQDQIDRIVYKRLNDRLSHSGGSWRQFLDQTSWQNPRFTQGRIPEERCRV